jgi:3-dehydroquinate synthetase
VGGGESRLTLDGERRLGVRCLLAGRKGVQAASHPEVGGCVEKEKRLMIMENTLALEREIRWKNPDPPHEEFRYTYYLRSGLQAWGELLELLGRLGADRFVIVSDGGFPSSLAEWVRDRIATVAPCTLLTFRAGEQAKNLATVYELGNAALHAGAIRSSVVIALGGGLAGNIAGLLAGLFLRGARLVHIPTTLLAMSDSCLSLKQGVNSELGKNHFGMFYPPQFVWTNLSFLDALPPREIRSALCELIKNVLAICPQLFDEIAGSLRPDARYSEAQIAHFVDLCIDAKCSVMRADALEKHEAVVLEYGHSVGHALELTSSGAFPHGLAVGVGMVVEATLAHHLGMLSWADLEAHYALLQANGASTAIPGDYSTETLLDIMRNDNKRGYLPYVPGRMDIVLLTGLGQPNRTGKTVLTQVDEEEVRAALDACRAV